MSPENQKILAEETRIANEAAALATNYVKSKIKNSSLKMRGIGSPKKRGRKNKNEAKPLLDATYIKPVMGDHRLLGFQFMSNRSGFVHHFGVISDNTRYLRTHYKTGTTFSKAAGNLKSQAFFDDIYKSSGALALLEAGLAKTRTRAITLHLQNTLLKINNTNG